MSLYSQRLLYEEGYRAGLLDEARGRQRDWASRLNPYFIRGYHDGWNDSHEQRRA